MKVPAKNTGAIRNWWIFLVLALLACLLGTALVYADPLQNADVEFSKQEALPAGGDSAEQLLSDDLNLVYGYKDITFSKDLYATMRVSGLRAGAAMDAADVARFLQVDEKDDVFALKVVGANEGQAVELTLAFTPIAHEEGSQSGDDSSSTEGKDPAGEGVSGDGDSDSEGASPSLEQSVRVTVAKRNVYAIADAASPTTLEYGEDIEAAFSEKLGSGGFPVEAQPRPDDADFDSFENTTLSGGDIAACFGEQAPFLFSDGAAIPLYGEGRYPTAPVAEQSSDFSLLLNSAAFQSDNYALRLSSDSSSFSGALKPIADLSSTQIETWLSFALAQGNSVCEDVGGRGVVWAQPPLVTVGARDSENLGFSFEASDAADSSLVAIAPLVGTESCFYVRRDLRVWRATLHFDGQNPDLTNAHMDAPAGKAVAGSGRTWAIYTDAAAPTLLLDVADEGSGLVSAGLSTGQDAGLDPDARVPQTTVGFELSALMRMSQDASGAWSSASGDAVEAHAVDAVGNRGTLCLDAGTLAFDDGQAYTDIAIDSDVPRLVLEAPEEGELCASPRKVAITLFDETFDLDRAANPDKVVVADASAPLLRARDFARQPDGSWRAERDFGAGAGEAVHSIECAYTDLAGRSADVVQRSFTVDMTAPEGLSLEFPQPVDYEGYDEQGNRVVWAAYPGSVTPRLAARDAVSGVASEVCAHDEQVLSSDLSEKQGIGGMGLSLVEGDAYDGVWGYDLVAPLRTPLSEDGVSVVDACGNWAERLSYADAARVAFGESDEEYAGIVLDSDDPRIEISFDNDDVLNGRYYKEVRTARIVVSDSSFGLMRSLNPRTQVAWAEGGAVSALSMEDFSYAGDDSWAAEIAFDHDADCNLHVELQDAVGRAVQRDVDDFTVDLTAPSLSVSFDNNEAQNAIYYKKQRTATIYVYERNFDAALVEANISAFDEGGAQLAIPALSPWTSDGDRHEARVYFGDEGHYRIGFSLSDSAGNKCVRPYDSDEFIIDMTAPSLELWGVENGGAYAGECAPGFSARDEHLASEISYSQIERVGASSEYARFFGERTEGEKECSTSYANIERAKDTDGVYHMTVQAHDKAGNTSEGERLFSVNRFGSTYLFTDAMGGVLGTYLLEPCDIVVTEINPSGLLDEVGEARLVQNTMVSRLVRGEDYLVSPVKNEFSWAGTSYLFPAKNFETDGYYRIMLHSEDMAGNVTENTMSDVSVAGKSSAQMSFAIDRHDPTAFVAGIENGMSYLSSGLGVSAIVRDNLALASASVSVDGRELACWEGEELAHTEALPLTLPEADSAQNVVVHATDLAGRSYERVYENVTVTSDPLRYWLHNPPLMAGTIVAIALLLALAALALYASRKKRARRRNLQRALGGA